MTVTGVGYKMGNELDRMGIKTAADLRQVSQETLVQKFGERTGTFLQLACRGQVSMFLLLPAALICRHKHSQCDISGMHSADRHLYRGMSPCKCFVFVFFCFVFDQ